MVSHGFVEAAKAMSKTARRSRAPNRASRQHPAILPWPSGLPIVTGDIRAVAEIGSGLAAGWYSG